jgi:FkbM family methyltransferase
MKSSDMPYVSPLGGAVQKSKASAFDGVRRLVRRCVPKPLYRLAAECTNTIWGGHGVGIDTYWKLRSLNKTKRAFGNDLTQIELPTLQHPLYVRPGTTDSSEVIQNCIRQAYGVLLPAEPVQLIVDAGASIGDTTAWFLSKFPMVTVIALEPAQDNYQLLLKNCGPYGSRALPLNAALWPRPAKLALCRSESADAHSVRDLASQRDDTVEGVSISALMKLVHADIIDLFKCDIEGAELEVFSDQCDDWLPRVRSILIEVHSAEAHATVLAACRRHGFHHSTYRGLQVFWR